MWVFDGGAIRRGFYWDEFERATIYGCLCIVEECGCLAREDHGGRGVVFTWAA